MNWDQKALEAWLEESARKDEDSLTLQKYTRADEGKVKVSASLLYYQQMFYILVMILVILLGIIAAFLPSYIEHSS